MSARDTALRCVLAATRDDAYANIVLPGMIREDRLDSRDAGLATELAYGALRMQGLYDAVIARAANRAPETLDPVVRASLWIGAHQALAMRVPAHAAVDETVSLVKSGGAPRASGLVNAVMRRITETDPDAWIARVAPSSSRTDLAVRTSHPEWIVSELEKALASDGRAGMVPALLEAHNRAAKVTLVARPGLADRAELAESTGGAPTSLSPWGVTLPGGDPGGIDAVRDRRAAVQDEGSQLAALALIAAPLGGPDSLWLDMCSGPGGKAGVLGAVAAARGGRLEALELHEHRARLVSEAVSALPAGTVEVRVADALKWDGGPYDRILLDAPCTGLGALRRRPESRWRRTPDDLSELTRLQTRLLERAAELLRPGGVLAYVTCSPVLSETREITDPTRLRAIGLRPIDARAVLADATGVAEGWGSHLAVQLWTDLHGTDSMFIALATTD